MVFRFRLQTLLDQKVRREEELQLELAILRGDYQTECLALERLEDEDAAQRGLLRRQQRERTLDLPAIGWSLDYLEMLKAREASQREVIAALAAKIEDRREALLAVMRERKTLEKLKERRYAQYLLEEKRLEGRIVDEISMSQYVRRPR